MCEKILLIDGHSILNRAFYGLPDLTNSEGLHTGAVYGFLNILFKVLGEEKPEYLQWHLTEVSRLFAMRNTQNTKVHVSPCLRN